MKSVNASEAQKTLFDLLDEVAAGAIVVVLHRGKRIIIRPVEPGDEESEQAS